jgi:osmotically-inducible protein OsmY
MTEHEHDMPRASNLESAGNISTLAGFGANQAPAEHEIDRQPTDRRLHEEVCTILTANDLLPIADLHVAVEAGVVTLHGAARDRRVRERAEEIAALIAGVRSVRNELSVLAGKDAV